MNCVSVDVDRIKVYVILNKCEIMISVTRCACKELDDWISCKDD